MKLKKIELIVIFTLVFSLIFHFVSFSKDCENIKKDVLRLHILANSDAAFDQNLKLMVRDAVLAEGYDVFDGVKTVEQAKRKVLKNLDTIEKIAKREITKNGYTYPVAVKLEKTFFETRYYRDFTLPAGEYEALKIVIGKGEGHNWWCVMFPSLCLAACGAVEDNNALSEAEKDLILSDPRFEVRFKCVEIYEKIKKML